MNPVVKRCYKCDRQTLFLKKGLCLVCREMDKLVRMISK